MHKDSDKMQDQYFHRKNAGIFKYAKNNILVSFLKDFGSEINSMATLSALGSNPFLIKKT